MLQSPSAAPSWARTLRGSGSCSAGARTPPPMGLGSSSWGRGTARCPGRTREVASIVRDTASIVEAEARGGLGGQQAAGCPGERSAGTRTRPARAGASISGSGHSGCCCRWPRAGESAPPFPLAPAEALPGVNAAGCGRCRERGQGAWGPGTPAAPGSDQGRGSPAAPA